MTKSATIKQCLKTACFLPALLTLSTTTQAAAISNVKITSMESYTSYDGAYLDLPVELSTACPSGGPWYLPVASYTDNKNSENAYALMLSAFMADRTIRVAYVPNKSPNFNPSSAYCEIHNIKVTAQ